VEKEDEDEEEDEDETKGRHSSKFEIARRDGIRIRRAANAATAPTP